jgi:hypothetical protein
VSFKRDRVVSDQSMSHPSLHATFSDSAVQAQLGEDIDARERSEWRGTFISLVERYGTTPARDTCVAALDFARHGPGHTRARRELVEAPAT